LNDLYVRFYRMAERCIADQTGRGVVSFISNYSWLDGLSHPGMRERYLEAFDVVMIDNLNGDKYKTGKTTPDGKPDPSIFSTEFNREGIQVGTAIATLVRKPQHEDAKTVHFRHLWGTGKLAQLKAEAADLGSEDLSGSHAIAGNRAALRTAYRRRGLLRLAQTAGLVPCVVSRCENQSG
jgi:predicted helicase